MATAAPAAKALLAEATRLFPDRSRASDGILPSAAHTIQNPKSGHERGDAADLTDDADSGCVAHDLADEVMRRRDPRILYVISERQIWSRARFDEGWRPYSGPNSHDTHGHFEIDPAHRADTGPFWPHRAVATKPAPAAPAAPPAPAPQPEPSTSRRRIPMLLNIKDTPYFFFVRGVAGDDTLVLVAVEPAEAWELAAAGVTNVSVSAATFDKIRKAPAWDRQT